MSDLGQSVEFGIFPSPDAAQLAHTLELASLAETVGLDHVSIQDHPYQAKHVDTWTLLAAIGSRTNAIRLSTNVANVPLRPPVVLAKAAATLDLITGGRVELGLGSGAFWDAIVAAGGPRRTRGEAVEALDEAIRLMRAVWAGGSVTFEGKHYGVKGFHAGPVPAHSIPIWVGAYKPRMMRLTGRLANGWVPSMGYADPPALPGLVAQLDEAAVAAGRSPAEIRRIYNVFGRFGSGSDLLQGNPREWSEQLAELVLGVGMDTFILGTNDPDAVRRFGLEVAPAVRELVDAERARPRTEPLAGSLTEEDGGRSAEQSARIAGRQGSSAASTLSVVPTPDDGTRLTGELDWDEASRPVASKPDTTYTPEQQGAAQHLVDIHDGLRQELAQVREIVDQVRTGHLSVGQARSVINTMTMRQNNWTLGAYCESYCRIVTGHHTLEDRSVFPHLRRSQPDLAPVIDRLEQEHVVIHDVLDRLDAALVGLVGTDGYGAGGVEALDELAGAVDLLTDTLLSHLSYEERELVHPLARYGYY